MFLFIIIVKYKLQEPSLIELSNSAQIFNALSDLPGRIHDVEQLLAIADEIGNGSLNQVLIDTQRRRHLSYLMAQLGALIGSDPNNAANLPKQHLARRQVKKNKSMIQMLLFGDEDSEDDAKSKNVKQTEVLVDLREAILQVFKNKIF